MYRQTSQEFTDNESLEIDSNLPEPGAKRQSCSSFLRDVLRPIITLIYRDSTCPFSHLNYAHTPTQRRRHDSPGQLYHWLWIELNRVHDNRCTASGVPLGRERNPLLKPLREIRGPPMRLDTFYSLLRGQLQVDDNDANCLAVQTRMRRRILWSFVEQIHIKLD